MSKKLTLALRIFFSGDSLQEVMDRNRGIGPGFDFIRIALAILILYAHTRVVISNSGFAADIVGGAINQPITDPYDALGLDFFPSIDELKRRLYVVYVPMFFALSGFLVAGSALRTQSIPRFLQFRVLRILPALSVEIFLSAFVLGTFFTTLPAAEYFTDPLLFRYFGNIFGVVSFSLPGVFLDNPLPGLVNSNLWTLPAEFYSYLLAVIMMCTGVLYRPRILLALIVCGSIALIFLSFQFDFGLRPRIYSTVAIVYYFLVGVTFYILRNKIRLNFILFALCCASTLIMVNQVKLTFLMPVFLTYVTIYIGHLSFLKFKILKGRDYSYGIYLYGFPITQAVVAIQHDISRIKLLLISFTLTACVAMFSWHFIEKPFLKLKTFSPKKRQVID